MGEVNTAPEVAAKAVEDLTAMEVDPEKGERLFKAAIIQSKEGVLRQDLFLFRDTIDQYYIDKGKYPASLDALVEDGYLRKIPIDPVTQQADWEAVLGPLPLSAASE